MVDHVVSEARRSEREGLVAGTPAPVLAERAAFWAPLAEDQGRDFTCRSVAGPEPSVHASEPTWSRWSTCSSTTSSPTPPREPASRVALARRGRAAGWC